MTLSPNQKQAARQLSSLELMHYAIVVFADIHRRAKEEARCMKEVPRKGDLVVLVGIAVKLSVRSKQRSACSGSDLVVMLYQEIRHEFLVKFRIEH